VRWCGAERGDGRGGGRRRKRGTGLAALIKLVEDNEPVWLSRATGPAFALFPVIHASQERKSKRAKERKSERGSEERITFSRL
jgi:hypothetical protein